MITGKGDEEQTGEFSHIFEDIIIVEEEFHNSKILSLGMEGHYLHQMNQKWNMKKRHFCYLLRSYKKEKKLSHRGITLS